VDFAPTDLLHRFSPKPAKSAILAPHMTDVVQKLWGFCHTLCHDGIDYGDYIEQITYLLFLKMADEKGVELPRKHEWGDLRTCRATL
jgi:hypothetical protein